MRGYIFAILAVIGVARAQIAIDTLTITLLNALGPLASHILPLGCYDNLDGRVLPYFLGTETGLTVNSCLDRCKATGRAIAGVMYGIHCYCGSAAEVQYAKRVGDDLCAVNCGGQSQYKCGGLATISLFDYDNIGPLAVGLSVGDRRIPFVRQADNTLINLPVASLCANANKNLIIDLDGSAAGTEGEFELLKTFLKGMLDQQNVSPATTMVALFQCSSYCYPEFLFGNHQNARSMKDAIDLMTWRRGPTEIGTTLDYINHILSNPSAENIVRRNVPTVLIIFSRAQSSDEPYYKGLQLRQLHPVVILFVGLGSGFKDPEQLEDITGARERVLLLSDAGQLLTLRMQQAISKWIDDRVCNSNDVDLESADIG